jgi:hypothetical protein
MPVGGKREGAGRPKGVPNRSTVERLLQVSIPYVQGEVRLAKDVLHELMLQFRALAIDAYEREDTVAFTRWAERAVDCASELAPYESPRLQAMALGPTPPASPTRFTLNIFESREAKQRQRLLLEGLDQHDPTTPQ